MEIVECVPNFSEGRRKRVVDAIVSEIRDVKGVRVLDFEMDADHNRSVITFVGEPNAVVKAAFNATKRASELIDMNRHKGEHPRIGATDVIPFIPISGVSMEDCVRLARSLGKEIAEKLKIPVYLYERAATRTEREDLAYVRRGEYEGLKKEIESNADRKPDFGNARLHPTAGATAVGARFPLIAYNVNLGTDSIEIAKKIAKAIRFRDGGLRYVKALGFEIKEKGIVQISMNLVNYEKSPMYRVFEMIKSEAERYGVPVIESEIVGLVPMNALIDVSEFYLKLNNFKKSQILENRLWE